MAEVRGDFAERHQHKAALVYMRVRQGQIRAFDDALAVEQQVEVEGARPPVNAALSLVFFFPQRAGRLTGARVRARFLWQRRR